MPEPLIVTADDIRAAWFDFHERSAELSHIETPGPRESDSFDRILLESLGRVLAADRRRVAERSQVSA